MTAGRLALSDAQLERRARGERLARQAIDAMVDELVTQVDLAGSSGLKNFQMVGPDARKHLKGLLDFYRKKPHPFTACVRDNTKRFGPEGAKKVCAVLTDLEKGTTKWRNGGNHSDLSDRFSEIDSPQLSEDLYALIVRIADIDYRATLGLDSTQEA